MLPELINGYLPGGRWQCSVDEVRNRFAIPESGDRDAIWSEWESLTSAIRQAVGEIAACWLSGSMFSDKSQPSDIDCLYVIDHELMTRAFAARPELTNFLDAVSTGQAKQVFNVRVDSYVLPWMPKSGTELVTEQLDYLQARGYWDDLWCRRKDGSIREQGLPRRGYLEVILDGYR